MDRRDFFRLSALGLAGLALDKKTFAESVGLSKKSGAEYSMVILGDTHFDTDPDTVYHTGYSDPDPIREANHRKEFVRNAKMWKSRCPSLVKRAACLIDDNTEMVLHMGDLIQGDTSGVETHKKMLADATDYLKGVLGAVPFVTVAGNHDLRARDDKEAAQAYEEYMPERLSKEIGRNVESTTFSFMVEQDAYIVIDFTHTDADLLERLLKQTEGARYTFIIVHGPVFPYDSLKSYRWILFGKDDEKRRRFRKLFAQREAIVLCGHTHKTEFLDWKGDGGRITQMTMNSVWSDDKSGRYSVLCSTPEEYGSMRAKSAKKSGSALSADSIELFDEYRPGILEYTYAVGAGSYKMNVSDRGVWVDFYAGDDAQSSETFVLRGKGPAKKRKRR